MKVSDSCSRFLDGPWYWLLRHYMYDILPGEKINWPSAIAKLITHFSSLVA